MTIRQYALYIALIISTLASAQDTVVVTPTFKFAPGVYLTFEAFQQNQPDYLWEEVQTNLAFNPKTFMTQVEYIQLKNAAEDSLDLQQIWGFCIEGIPFIRLPQEAISKELTTFAGLQVRGQICYFNYTTTITREVEITAYNPLNGRPFRQGTIEKTEDIVVEKMLDFSTGNIVDYSRQNLLIWIENDEKLYKTVAELPEAEVQQKLFKCLLIYNDRHAVFVERKEEN